MKQIHPLNGLQGQNYFNNFSGFMSQKYFIYVTENESREKYFLSMHSKKTYLTA